MRGEAQKALIIFSLSGDHANAIANPLNESSPPNTCTEFLQTEDLDLLLTHLVSTLWIDGILLIPQSPLYIDMDSSDFMLLLPPVEPQSYPDQASQTPFP